MHQEDKTNEWKTKQDKSRQDNARQDKKKTRHVNLSKQIFVCLRGPGKKWFCMMRVGGRVLKNWLCMIMGDSPKKNPACRRHWISLHVLIRAKIPKKVHQNILCVQCHVSHVICHLSIAKKTIHSPMLTPLLYTKYCAWCYHKKMSNTFTKVGYYFYYFF